MRRLSLLAVEWGWPDWMRPVTPAAVLIGVGLPLLLAAVVVEGMVRWWRKERK